MHAWGGEESGARQQRLRSARLLDDAGRADDRGLLNLFGPEKDIFELAQVA